MQLGLAETMEALRAELVQAAAAGAAAGFQFPVAGVQLEFHVGVTKTGEGKAGVRLPFRRSGTRVVTGASVPSSAGHVDRRLGDSGILTPRPGPGMFPRRGSGRWLRRAG